MNSERPRVVYIVFVIYVSKNKTNIHKERDRRQKNATSNIHRSTYELVKKKLKFGQRTVGQMGEEL